jgi:hypothetical protein
MKKPYTRLLLLLVLAPVLAVATHHATLAILNTVAAFGFRTDRRELIRPATYACSIGFPLLHGVIMAYFATPPRLWLAVLPTALLCLGATYFVHTLGCPELHDHEIFSEVRMLPIYLLLAAASWWLVARVKQRDANTNLNPISGSSPEKG